MTDDAGAPGAATPVRDRRDPSNGWEAVAAHLIAHREKSSIGVETVRAWGRTLPGGVAVLDLGCGSGMPISRTLIEDGFVVHGVDASPTLVTAFRNRFPTMPVACEAAETSSFFGRRFDAVVAVGLVFLLAPETQRLLIRKVADALQPGGRFLFSAPVETGRWADISTGRESVSLGEEAYRAALSDAGLEVVGSYVDEGQSHYYDACKMSAPAGGG